MSSLKRPFSCFNQSFTSYEYIGIPSGFHCFVALVPWISFHCFVKNNALIKKNYWWKYFQRNLLICLYFWRHYNSLLEKLHVVTCLIRMEYINASNIAQSGYLSSVRIGGNRKERDVGVGGTTTVVLRLVFHLYSGQKHAC